MRACAWERAAGVALLLGLLVLLAPRLHAQELEFHPPPTPVDAGTPAFMRDLAGRVLPVYEDRNAARFLDNLSAMQALAGAHAPAQASRLRLRERRGAADVAGGEAGLLDIYIHALDLQRESGGDFAAAFARAFREAVEPLDDLAAYGITGWRMPSLNALQDDLQRAFDQRRSRAVITLPDAVLLLRRYFVFEALRRVAEPFARLADEDDHRRYVFETLQVAAAGVPLDVQVVRPRREGVRLPAIFEFTIHRDPREPVTGPAAHGYAGVLGWTRGSGSAPGRAIPFQFDGADARAVIKWIAAQPWNDGRVAMQGEGYSGFTAWAAAGDAPPELQAIATTDPMAPGIDMPMSGGIFHNASYRWAQRVAGSRGDEADLDDDGTWWVLDETWYRSGQRYRDLDRLNKRPNRYFQRWLNHPSYDRFWQKMIPFREQFAGIRIPVLTLTGYYAAGQAGALYYFGEHLQHLPDADHRIVLSPYARLSGERASAFLRRIPVDAVARLDADELRYQWFDHVLKGQARPAPLQDRVNFVTQGVNQWRHARDLDAMANERLRLHLDAQEVDGGHLLARHDEPPATFVAREIPLRDREEAVFVPQSDLVARAVDAPHGLVYISAPLASAVDVAGVVSGRLDVMTNKFDVDFSVALYELQASGDYVKLFDPSIAFRASYARDRVQRRLLKPGRLEQIAFSAERVTSRRLAAGSRLVAVVAVNKRPDQQINYGAGNDVSEESVADARHPVRLRWYSSSYLDIPVRTAR